MYQETIDQLKTKLPNYKLYTIISYDIVNNFTEESIVNYLCNTYGVNIPDKSIHGDPFWYGRGSVLLNEVDAKKIPSNWESKLSESYGELEFANEFDEDC